MKFDEFKLNAQILEAISYMGYEDASPIQEQTIPSILEGLDLIACAQTGTGKTAAFMLPLLDRISNSKKKGLKAIIIVPVREIAKQIDQQIQGFSYFSNTSSLAIYGGGDGTDWDAEKNALLGNVDIIVCTPGRLISHLNMGYVKFDKIEYLVLDEADKMLDMGFYSDIQKIASFLPKRRQTLMFSATMPPKIRDLAKLLLQNPVEVSIELSKPAEGVLQAAYLTFEDKKDDLIISLITDKPLYQSILIFTSVKTKVSSIVKALKHKKFSAEGISSDLEQAEREDVLQRFASRQTRVLVATDVLSRGIDIKDINLIINYDVPHDAEDYVHRVGRTARANTTGVAITFINEKEQEKFLQIEKLIGREIYKTKMPIELGNSPEWNPRTFEKKKRFKPRNKSKIHKAKSS
ncbi:MAG: DEAD/DEAH box helicase [Bacteroidota bacterium]